MFPEREIASRVSQDSREKLEKLYCQLHREEKQEKKSRQRRWKNLRGIWEVGYLSGSEPNTALFWWDPARRQDVIEMTLFSSLDEESLKDIALSAEGRQNWSHWEVEENEKKVRIFCGYQKEKFARLNPPGKRARLLFHHLGLPVLETRRILVK